MRGDQAAKRRTTLTSSCASKGLARYASALQRSAPRRGSARQVKRPGGMRTAVEVVPKLGVKSGMPALRIGGVATYDRPIEHLAGQLDVLDLRVPLRSKDGRYGLVLCFALEGVPLDRLGAELIRVSHPDGAIWLVVWKKGLLREGASSWNEAQEAMLETGWVDNKILSLGEEVYATRYVRGRRPPMREPDGGPHRS